MRKDTPGFSIDDPYWHMKVEKSSSLEDVHKTIFNVLTLKETREIFGLTYRDFIEMDKETFDYITGEIYRLYKLRKKAEEEAEMEMKNGKHQ